MIYSFRRLLSAAFCSVAIASCSLSVWAANTVPQSFIDDISHNYQLDPAWVAAVAAKANKQQTVIDRMNTPWEAKPWYQYQAIFLKKERLEQGLAFWQKYETELAKAEAQYGVPAQFMVAILGVETYFGRFKGGDPVLDALYTLGFHFPKRGKFFRSELGHFLALSHEQGWQPETIMGSYAGAMGFPQFISSSYRAYAVDFDGDGKRDLLNSPVDAIGSIANYFARHGWRQGECLATQVDLPNQAAKWVQTDTKLRHNWGQLKQAGLTTNLPLNESEQVMLFPLAHSAEQTHHYLGCNNFYVITRYNHSRLYAMAVYRLSEWLKKEHSARS